MIVIRKLVYLLETVLASNLFSSYRWQTIHYCGPGVNIRHFEVWDMFGTVVKGFANRRKILADCYPGYAKRTGDMKKIKGIKKRRDSFPAPHL